MESIELEKRCTAMWKQIAKDVVSTTPGLKGAKFSTSGANGFILYIDSPIPLLNSPKAHYTFAPTMGGQLRDGVLGLSCVLDALPGIPTITCTTTIPLTKSRPGFTAYDPEALRELIAKKFPGEDSALYEGAPSKVHGYAAML